ncbi:unnamed protein product [Vitrella brassicaformis CCMP3155]|uniref:Uncharacterized protein n=3 Tax=Vitrella brassicaformis TaxID=1169539 RepID=A0A0G4GJE4_VITBC|nr:unnamed protein product [Vitrella brassicaformis CCMP3155]|eukprot:CEM30003.1 unnamed protein product [Vitrella brassicaformis CCMP3155]
MDNSGNHRSSAPRDAAARQALADPARHHRRQVDEDQHDTLDEELQMIREGRYPGFGESERRQARLALHGASSASASRPPSPPLSQPAELFDLSLPISKMAAMAVSTDDAKRAALRSQIATRTRQQELLGHTAETANSTLLNGVQQHIDKAIRRLGLADILAFDIDGGVEAGLKVIYVLERGSGEEWRAMGRFLRLIFIYRLTPADATRPLRLSADALPTAAAFHQLPLAMALYKIVGHLLTRMGTRLALQRHCSLALQHGNDGSYWIGHEAPFRVVPLGDLPGGHPYADGYKRSDPVIRRCGCLFRSFSAFLLDRLHFWWWDGGGGVKMTVLTAKIGRDPRYDRLVTEGITGDLGITVDERFDHGDLNHADARDGRRVMVSGFRPGETVAAYLYIAFGYIVLRTTDTGGDRSQPVAERLPESMPLWRRVLWRYNLESDVIDRGWIWLMDPPSKCRAPRIVPLDYYVRARAAEADGYPWSPGLDEMRRANEGTHPGWSTLDHDKRRQEEEQASQANSQPSYWMASCPYSRPPSATHMHPVVSSAAAAGGAAAASSSSQGSTSAAEAASSVADDTVILLSPQRRQAPLKAEAEALRGEVAAMKDRLSVHAGLESEVANLKAQLAWFKAKEEEEEVAADKAERSRASTSPTAPPPASLKPPHRGAGREDTTPNTAAARKPGVDSAVAGRPPVAPQVLAAPPLAHHIPRPMHHIPHPMHRIPSVPFPPQHHPFSPPPSAFVRPPAAHIGAAARPPHRPPATPMPLTAQPPLYPAVRPMWPPVDLRGGRPPPPPQAGQPEGSQQHQGGGGPGR